jgi:DNA-binding transcriptional MerR regulator
MASSRSSGSRRYGKEAIVDWSIQDIARMTGTTSRTLRHYDAIGLLKPTRIGANGYRYYDSTALMRLQRILLLRDLGLGLTAIGEVLANQVDTGAALRHHLAWLRRERARLADQIASLETTIARMEGKEPQMAEDMFKGFDHTRYRDEVIERWGKQAWESGNDWWNRLSDEEKQAFQQQQLEIATDYGKAMLAGKAVESDEVQAITQRQFEWVSRTGQPGKEHFIGLGQLYVDDPRFTATYDAHGAGTAAFIRDAMKVYAEQNL